MNRYLVSIIQGIKRTEIEAIAKSSMDALIAVVASIGIDERFSVTVKPWH